MRRLRFVVAPKKCKRLSPAQSKVVFPVLIELQVILVSQTRNLRFQSAFSLDWRGEAPVRGEGFRSLIRVRPHVFLILRVPPSCKIYSVVSLRKKRENSEELGGTRSLKGTELLRVAPSCKKPLDFTFSISSFWDGAGVESFF